MLGYGSDVSLVGKFLLTLICIYDIVQYPSYFEQSIVNAKLPKPLFRFPPLPTQNLDFCSTVTLGYHFWRCHLGNFWSSLALPRCIPGMSVMHCVEGNSNFQSHQSQDSSHLTSDISNVDIYIGTSFTAIRVTDTSDPFYSCILGVN